VDVLDSSFVMRLGAVHIWSIEVVKSVTSLRMGFACFRKEGHKFVFNSSFLYSKSGNSYRTEQAQHTKTKSSSRFPNFHAGSVITFRLDLTGSGTLSAQVNKDSSNEFVLFENIFREGEDIQSWAVSPAALVQAPGEIHFLGFET
jgi:hypothetical protein